MSKEIDIELERAPEPVLKPVTRGPSDEVLSALRERHRKDLEAKREKREESDPASVLMDAGAVHVSTTTAPETMEQYAKRASQIYHRYLRANGYPAETNIESLDMIAFIGWFMTLKATLKPGSWRMYRQSIYRFLRSMPEGQDDVNEAMSILEHDTAIRSADALSGKKPKNENFTCVDGKERNRSSSKKEKRFPEKDMDRIIHYLRHGSRSSRAIQLETWLKAGIITGLRPSEWQATQISIIPDETTIHGRRAWLFVINAKATNGRGSGVVRTLDLSRLPNDLLQIVARQSENGRKWYIDGTFEKEQKETANLLSQIVHRMWPKRKYHYSLYSCRHQAVANWKSFGMSKMEIACLSGHRSIETATERYGRRTAGWQNIPENNIVRPVKEDMERALQYEETLKKRLEARNMLRQPKPSEFTL